MSKTGQGVTGRSALYIVKSLTAARSFVGRGFRIGLPLIGQYESSVHLCDSNVVS